MIVVLLIGAAVILWSMWSMHRNQAISLSLFDLITENDRLSKIACTFLASFAISSWVLVKLTLDGKLTEGLFTAYGAFWIAPLVAKVVFNKSTTETKP
jgi:hypothetical protein